MLGHVEGRLAREEAIKRSSTVRVCPSANGRFCRSDGNWDQGWLVYTDGNADGAVQEIELIQAFPAPSEQIHIVAGGGLPPERNVGGLEDVVGQPGIAHGPNDEVEQAGGMAVVELAERLDVAVCRGFCKRAVIHACKIGHGHAPQHSPRGQ